ncbi:MAG: DNA polymerase III subunit gamma/tau [Chitinophagales bacterium]|nr:DNA polymerase III subunit gamma/tau [Chitinophagales bacterium]MDW8392677.1 DNA polymerase III subunit gamma/tau [Chitinophagales bacterium]
MTTEGFLVSARKYRPLRFADVLGQPQVTATLKNALVTGKVAQAYLFCGPRGVGKTTCARILAMAVNCERPEAGGEPCNQCASCVAFVGNTSMNIFELDAASNNSVDDIRALIEQVRYVPQYGKKKIYIIDEVHMLSQQAFNAFLKTLEEPPAHAIFILATTEKHRILPTILSRCQIFDFHRITVSDMVAQLSEIAQTEHIEADADALHLIAQKADGAMRDALSMFDRLSVFGGGKLRYADVAEVLNVLDYDYYFQLTDLFLSGDSAAALKVVHQILQGGFEPAYFLQGLAEHFRELLVARDAETHHLLQFSPAVQQRYIRQAALVPMPFLLSALSLTAEAEYQLRDSRNKRLQAELLVLRLCFLPAVTEAPASGNRASVAEKKNDLSEAASEQPSAAPIATTSQPADATTATASRLPIPTLDMLRKQAENQQAPIDNLVTAAETEPIDPAAFDAIRKLMLVHLHDQLSPGVLKFLDAFPPQVVNGHVIRFRMANDIQAQAIRSELEPIRKFFCDQLGRKNIEMRVEVEQEPTTVSGKKTPFTPQEKFAALAEKYPLLRRLKDELQLELDY